jgi:hypothetical protein
MTERSVEWSKNKEINLVEKTHDWEAPHFKASKFWYVTNTTVGEGGSKGEGHTNVIGLIITIYTIAKILIKLKFWYFLTNFEFINFIM